MFSSGSYVFVCAIILVINVSFITTRKIVADNEIRGNDGCRINNRVFKVGEKWSEPGECVQYTCQRGGGYSAVTCAVMRFQEGSECHFSKMDFTKPYPQCCPQVVCPEGKEE